MFAENYKQDIEDYYKVMKGFFLPRVSFYAVSLQTLYRDCRRDFLRLLKDALQGVLLYSLPKDFLTESLRESL